MVSSASEVRNDQLRLALGEAIEHGDRRLLGLLARHGGLPGPQPNHELAVAVGDVLAGHRGRAEAVVRELISLDERQAPGQSPQIFLMMVGAQALAGRILGKFEVERSWASLQELAGDVRRPVRDGVAAALERLGARLDADELLLRLGAWTDGFLQGAVALEALARRTFLDRLSAGSPALLEERLEEVTKLIEQARRADERTQGRRRLLEALSEALPSMAARVPALLGWLERRVTTEQPELRGAFEHALQGLQRQGLRDDVLDPIRRALDGSRAPLRDPTHYKGPTRGRGRKAQRREQRR